MTSSPSLKIAMIIQARMGSTRLPGKPLMEILDKTILEFLLERVKRVKLPIKIIVATSSLEENKPILEMAKRKGVEGYSGSEEDVLDRYVKAARHFDADVIIRVTADCPLIDPNVIDQVLERFLDNYPKFDYVSNTLQRTYPRGMDVEVFKRRSLEHAYEEAFLPEEREHVTLHIYRHPEKFQIEQHLYKEDLSLYRWTLDTQEDFSLLEKILETIYPEKNDFTLEDLRELHESHPDWSDINKHVKQKTF